MLGDGLMARQRTLTPLIKVRILVPQPLIYKGLQADMLAALFVVYSIAGPTFLFFRQKPHRDTFFQTLRLIFTGTYFPVPGCQKYGMIAFTTN